MLKRRTTITLTAALAVTVFLSLSSTSQAHVAAATSALAPTSTLHATSSRVAAAWWDNYSGLGLTLHIIPTNSGRTLTTFDPSTTFSQAIQIAGWRPYSSAVYDSLYNQMRCHADYFPWKNSWNVDTWRPDVGYWSTVYHQCNP